MLLHAVASGLALAAPIVAQQIYDIWSTTWQRDNLFTYKNLNPNPINFVSPGSTGTSDIVVTDSTVYQQMIGFGAALTDSSAKLLSELKSTDSDTYWDLLNLLFDPTDGGSGAGFTYLRIPLGASDFSASVYSFDDVSGDTSLSSFNINNAPSYLFSTLQDIVGINSYLKIQITPWSPPGWMKDSGTMNGGKMYTSYASVYANYLLKCLQGYQSKGFSIWAISIQNEPQNSNPSYPTNLIDPYWEGQVATQLRSLMNENGFSDTIIIGYDHNWDDAGEYPVELMEDAAAAFDGVSFHCYAGSVSDQETFYNAYPSKNIYFTECTGEFNSDWWSDIKWYLNNIFIGSVNYYSRNAAMWNLVLDGEGNPKTPGTTSCGGSDPCRGVVTVNSNGTYHLNQEFYAIAQASKAILPKDSGGPFGQRIEVAVNGNQNLVVSAFVTHRVSSSDWLRYSLVVLNQNDDNNGSWDPVNIEATIEFRGQQATYTFPVGVTTLWWYAASE
ncbi:glycoside hydrolase family 30 protein [Postia placenta MAD-698-R-SB12]|uniref:Glycoside hydrolase family 30 protein n=1 Tax=Postia placenta MAD-698-R-SB12 TaxID=670580 RepID=A0A1X6MZP2_9APHY|nr:glycoside hydrolase family 30 protein [Postia placenta MAD-698-R-SB12]OSX61841.1 glycoside hydrolase family 30 protein [Postia placenta MAD-698-R-SB12]